MIISNDTEFKTALNDLSRARQRLVAARFAENVLTLSRDSRIKNTINSAKHADISADELAAAFRAAKAASVDSYTQCGHECDWNNQASHFVAEAVLSCVKPAEPGSNAAWDAAMHARMARTCASIAAGNGTSNGEDAAQYRILAEFLKG